MIMELKITFIFLHVTHWSPPQKPFVQVPSQHSVAVVQAEPVPVHTISRLAPGWLGMRKLWP